MNNPSSYIQNPGLPVFVEVKPDIYVPKDKLLSNTEYREYIQYRPGVFVPRDIPLNSITKDTSMTQGVIERLNNSSINGIQSGNTSMNVTGKILGVEYGQPRIEYGPPRVISMTERQPEQMLYPTVNEVRDRKPTYQMVSAKKEEPEDHFKSQKKSDSCEDCGCCKKFSLFHLIGFILALILLILAIIFFNNLKEKNTDYSYFYGLSDGWNKVPIRNVSIANDSRICPTTNDHPIGFSFAGLEKGCNCTGIITKGECQNKDECVEIPEVSPEELIVWENGTLCQRDFSINNEDLDYFKLHVIPSNSSNVTSSCPKDYNLCGIIDTYDNYLCVPNTTACPINSIEVSNYLYKKDFSFDDPTIPSINVPEDQKIQDNIKLKNSNFKFYNNKDPVKSRIPIMFKTAYKTPCENPAFINTPDINLYPLEPFYGKQKCLKFSNEVDIPNNITTFNDDNKNKTEYIDDNFSLIDIYGNKDYILDNQVFENYTTLPKQYTDELEQNNLGLWVRNYPGINATCHKYIRENNLGGEYFKTIENLQNVPNMRSIMVALLIIAILIVLIILFFLICELFVNVRRNSILLLILWVFLFILFAILLTALILAIIEATKLSSVSGLDEIFNSNCLDSFSVDQYNNYFSYISSCRILLIFIIILIVVLIILYLIFLYFAWKKDWFISKDDDDY